MPASTLRDGRILARRAYPRARSLLLYFVEVVDEGVLRHPNIVAGELSEVEDLGGPLPLVLDKTLYELGGGSRAQAEQGQ
ncbi:MAG: hypothetical protein AAFR95_15745 [Bacteroidota bacterium]